MDGELIIDLSDAEIGALERQFPGLAARLAAGQAYAGHHPRLGDRGARGLRWPPDSRDDRVPERLAAVLRETAEVLRDPRAIGEIEAARADMASGSGVRGGEAVAALRPRR